MCAIRESDEEEKEAIMTEIHITYEEILQLEQALIEVDEQNTTNTLEIRKREAKMIFIMKQVEEIEDVLMSKENNTDAEQRHQYQDQANTLSKQIVAHRQQIEILNESTKQNLLKRQSMKQNLYEYYQQIRKIKESINTPRVKL